MIKKHSSKFIITALLIVLSASCFSLLFTSIYKHLNPQQPSADTESVYNFDKGVISKPTDSGYDSNYASDTYYNSYNSYEISSTTGLNNFAASVAEGFNFTGKTVTLKADLDYSDSTSTFIPIGYTLTSEGKFKLGSAIFNGTFDGGGYVVSGITIDGSMVSSDFDLGDNMPCGLGFFAYLGVYAGDSKASAASAANSPCVVKSLQISNMTITAPAYNAAIGGIAGATYRYYTGTSITGKNSISIENCVVTDLNVDTSLNYSTFAKDYFMGVGGLVGCTLVRAFDLVGKDNLEYVQITNCIVNDMNITGSTDAYDSIVALSPGLGILRVNISSSLISMYLISCYNLTNCITNMSYVNTLSIHGSNVPTVCTQHTLPGLYTVASLPNLATGYFFPGPWEYVNVASEITIGNKSYYPNEAVSGVFDGNHISNAIDDTLFAYSIMNYYYDSSSLTGYCTGGPTEFSNYDYNSDGVDADGNSVADKRPWFIACYCDSSETEWCTPVTDKVYLKTFLTKVSIGADYGSTTVTTALVPKGSTPTTMDVKDCFVNKINLKGKDHVISSELTVNTDLTSKLLCIDAYYISGSDAYLEIGSYSYVKNDIIYTDAINISLFNYCLATANSDIYEFQVWAINEKSYVAHFVDTSRTITFEAESNTDKTTSATYKIKIGSGISVRTSDTQCQFSFTDATGAKVTYTYTLNSTATTKYIAGYIVGSNMYNSTSSDRITISANTTLSARIETKSYNIGFG